MPVYMIIISYQKVKSNEFVVFIFAYSEPPWCSGCSQEPRVRFGSPSLSDEPLSRGPVFRDALKPEPLPVEPLCAPGHKTINPPGQYGL